MGKHKSVQEMMKERQPLTRTSIEPSNIYSLAPPEPTPTAAPKQHIATPQRTKKKTDTPAKKTTAIAAHDNAKAERPYSTYVRKEQVRGVKLRAVEREIDDKDIVQEALDEYFKNHPL
jgi:hypothetical protein